MDLSSERIHSLLPLFLATGLGLSVLYIGIREGVAEATALITKLFSGVVSDYLGKRKGLAVLGYGLGAWGLVLLILADLALGILLWGLHMGMPQGLLAAMVARTAPVELRGTACGLLNLVSGIALLLASSIAGALWHFLGSAATFQFGALAAVASLLVLAACRRSVAPLAG